MANKGIKGITISLGADTTGLDKALRDVNQKSRDLQGELKQVERMLKFDPGNTTLVAQQQEILSEQVANTTEKLKRLKEAQSQVQRQFQSGEIGVEQYRAFQREITATEGQLSGLKQKLEKVGDGNSVQSVKQDLSQVGKEAENAQGAVKNLGGELSGMAAGLAAGGGLAGVIQKALDTSSLNTKIEISMEIPPESMQSVKDAINTVSSYGVDAEAALEGVRRQWALNKDASDEANQAIVEGAGTIAAAYSGIDFTELIQETNEISSALNITNEEALGLTNSLLKMGFPPEQIDIIAEYGTQLSEAGYSAQEVQAIMAAGVETGTWNIDNLLDGLKEGRIKLAEFGQEVPKATKELLEGTGISTKQLQDWGQAVAKGGEAGKTAMQEVAQALVNVEDETQRNALGTQFFGTMWEDQGTNITDTLLNMNDHLMSAKENQDGLNAATAQLNADPAVAMKQAFSDMMTALAPLFTKIAEFVSKIAEWVSANPQLAATITAVVTAIGILMGILMVLAPIFTAMSAAATALGIGLLPLIGIVAGIVAAIALLIAAGIAIYQNWDTIKAKAAELAQTIKEKFEEFRAGIEEKMDAAKEKITEIWNNITSFLDGIDIKETGKRIILTMVNGIAEMIAPAVAKVTELWTNVKTFIDSIDIIEDAKRIITTFINGIGNKISDTVNKAKELWKNVTNFLDSIDITEIAKRIFVTFISGIAAKISDTKSKVEDLWRAAKTFLDGIDIIENGKKIFSTFINGIGAKISETKGKVEELWNNAKSFLEGIDLSTIGKNIIQGLINGIGSMASSITTKVRELASLIPDGLMDFLDMHSPSRLTHGLGEFVGEGFANGIASTLNDIQKMSDKMAAAAIPKTSIDNSKSYTPTIHISAGPSSNDIARAVERAQRRLAFQF